MSVIFQESCKPRVLHYQHELDNDLIGPSIVRAYRECALAIQRGDFKRSEKLEDFLFAVAWEKLNTGHYSMVHDSWRELYSAVSTCKALRLSIQKFHLVFFSYIFPYSL